MKRVMVAIVFLLVIAGGCITVLSVTQSRFSSLLSQTEQLEQYYQQNETQKAVQSATRFSQQINRNVRLFSLFMPHKSLIEVQTIAASLPVILTDGDTADFLTELSKCRVMLTTLQQQEFPFLENIL